MERNSSLDKVKSRTIPLIPAPRWKIWVTKLLSLTIFLLISCKSLASFLNSSVLLLPESLLDFWKLFLLPSSVLGFNQTAPSIVSHVCYWNSEMLKNEMGSMLISSKPHQPVKKFRYVIIILLRLKNLDKLSQPFIKVHKYQFTVQSFPKITQSYQISNIPQCYLFFAGVLGDEFLEMLFTGRRTMEKEKVDTNDRLLSEQPNRYLNNLNNVCAGTMEKSNSSISLPNLKPPQGGSTNRIKKKRGDGSYPRFKNLLIDMINVY